MALKREFPHQRRIQSYVDEISKTHPYSFFEELKYYIVSLVLIVAYAIDLIGFSTFVVTFLFYLLVFQVISARMNYFLAAVLEGLAGDLAAVNEKLNTLKENLESIDKGLESELQNLEDGLHTLDEKLILISEKIS